MPDFGHSVDQTDVWFNLAHDLDCASNAIKREQVNGHLSLHPPLSPEQVTQRQAILGIAHAVIESARKRALDAFHQLQHSDTCEKNTQAGS